MTAQPLQIGPYQIHTIVTSRFGLDGGAMFGSVPKAVWRRQLEADANNLVGLVARTLVVRGDGRTFLVDTGIGHRFPDEARARFDIDPGVDILGSLSRLDIEASEVSDVLLTHLHFDHAGGLFQGPMERPEPVFPRARILVQRSNWERGRDPGPKERASYRPEDVEPLARCDVKLLGGNEEVFPGIRVRATDGHTVGHQTVEIDDGSTYLIYTGDLVPTASHLRLAYTMGYDMSAETLVRDKQALLKSCMERDGILVFDHDPRTAACRLGENEKGFFIREKIDF